MQCERILHHILRLLQARVLFSVSDVIYLQWLELANSYGVLEKVGSKILDILASYSQIVGRLIKRPFEIVDS